jgi:hypothetical protein
MDLQPSPLTRFTNLRYHLDGGAEFIWPRNKQPFARESDADGRRTSEVVQ